MSWIKRHTVLVITVLSIAYPIVLFPFVIAAGMGASDSGNQAAGLVVIFLMISIILVPLLGLFTAIYLGTGKNFLKSLAFTSCGVILIFLNKYKLLHFLMRVFFYVCVVLDGKKSGI